jgi:hypothetical protein
MAADYDELLVENERLKSQRDILIRNSSDTHDMLREAQVRLKQLEAENGRLAQSLVNHVTNGTLKNDAIRELRMELAEARNDALDTSFWRDRVNTFNALPWWRRLWRKA